MSSETKNSRRLTVKVENDWEITIVVVSIKTMQRNSNTQHYNENKAQIEGTTTFLALSSIYYSQHAHTSRHCAYAGDKIEMRVASDFEFRIATLISLLFFGARILELPPRCHKPIKNCDR